MPNYRLAAHRAAVRFGLDPVLFERQINAESGFNPNAGSSVGARGIAQFMPATAASNGVNLNDGRVNDDLNGAARLMAGYVKKYGSYRNALIAYNAGPGRVGKPLFAETAAYVAKILNGSDPKGLSDAHAVTPRASRSQQSTATTTTQTTPSVDNRAARAAAIQTFLGRSHQDPLAFALNIRDLQDVPGTSKTTRTTTGRPAAPAGAQTAGAVPTAGITAPKGTATFEGKRVAAWIAPALTYARKHGWTGTVASGYRSFAEQTRIYNSGVRPAARPGTSNHEGGDFPRGAVDVTQAEQLSRILSNSPYGKVLKWAGSKDPVHFSHPHNGSY